MSYALRNTLALGIVLLLTVLGGKYWTSARMGKELKQLRAEETRCTNRVDEMNRAVAEYDTARVVLKRLKASWARLRKVIPSESSTASSFAYLNDLMAFDRSSIQFTFTSQREVKEGEYGYRVYSVVGTGSFRDVYNLIWRIEHEKRLVKIDRVRVQEQRVQKKDRTWSEMQFEMVLHAYYSLRTMPGCGETMAYDARYPYVGYNPFYPLVQEQLPPNRDGLVEVEGAALVAMTADRVIVQGGRGRRATLRAGDRVYLGQLESIQPDARRAVFVLNKGGLVDQVVLEMSHSKSNE